MNPKKPKNSNGRRRLNLWGQDPHCYYCHKELKWEEATLEHLYSKVKNGKYKGKRAKRKKEIGKKYTVLSCKTCNQERQLKEQAEVPRWRIWRKSRSFPRFLRKDLTLIERFIILWYQFNLDYKPERV
jgi:hypothetical protein